MFCFKFKRLSANRWLNLSSHGKRWHIIKRARAEMRQVQRTDKIVFSRAACKRLAHELLIDMGRFDRRFTKGAYDALAEAMQQVGTTFFEDCYNAAELTGHKTIMPKHAVHVRNQWKKQDDRVEATR